METPLKLSIVLPTYKEKENLAVFIPQILAEFQDTAHEIIVVDDGSHDGTRELLEEMRKAHPNVLMIERAGLLGLGSALRDGYNKASGEYILSSDADCSFSSGDMRALYQKIASGFDLVLGYKISQGAHDAKPGSFSFHGWCENKIISPMSNFVIGLLCGIGLKNYNTDFRIMRRDLWQKLTTVEDRHFFLFEVILKARRAGAKITEIPVTFAPRLAGESKVSFFRQAPAYFWKLIKVVFFSR